MISARVQKLPAAPPQAVRMMINRWSMPAKCAGTEDRLKQGPALRFDFALLSIGGRGNRGSDTNTIAVYRRFKDHPLNSLALQQFATPCGSFRRQRLTPAPYPVPTTTRSLSKPWL
jgi:hypothetical protein